MSRRHLISRLILLALLTLPLLLTGCGGGDNDGGTNPPPPPPDEEIEPLWEETTAAIDAADAVIDQGLGSVPLIQLFADAAAALADHDCVATVNLDTLNNGDPQLVAEFVNGMVLWMPLIDVLALPQQNGTPPHHQAERAEKENDLPAGRSVLLLDNDEWVTDLPVYKQMFDAAGYSSERTPGIDLNDMRALNLYDVVFLNTHGALIERGGSAYFVMATNEVRNQDTDLALIEAGDFQDFSVLFADAIFRSEEKGFSHHEDPRYTVSNMFIQKYSGPFDDNSFFYANCCHSMRPSEILPDMPLARTLGRLNLGTLIGWDDRADAVHAFGVSSVMLGWMLGNFHPDLQYAQNNDEPFRPNSLLDSYTALQYKTWWMDPYGTRLIYLQLNGTSELLLRPSINQLLLQVDAESGEETLKLLGDFGTSEGTVTVYSNPADAEAGGGTTLSVQEWTPEHVVVGIDEETAGYVVATVDEVTSNAHPLSSWEGDMESTGTVPGDRGPMFELTMHTAWRAEICNERGRPDLAPNDTLAWTGTMLGKASSCEYSLSGTFEDARYIYEYPEGANDGTQNMRLDDGEMFFGTVTLKPNLGEAMFQIVFAHQANILKTDKEDPEAGPVPDVIDVYLGYIFIATIDPQGVVAEGQTLVPYQLTWPEMTPDYPVREDTGR